jgi:sarcosine oxidase
VTYDLAVLGLGGMGSAVAARAALAGRRVLGLERFGEAHEFGASSGRSRIIRKAYFESPDYVPLLLRAYELWRDLEARTGTRLMHLGGLLMAGPADGAVVRGARASAAEYGLELAQLERFQVARRFPALRLRAGEAVLFEREAGVVFPERTIAAHLEVARAAGAELRYGAEVLGYESRAGGIALRLGDGSTVVAGRLAICAGPWAARVARELGLPIRVQRNVQVWFEPLTRAFRADRFPAFFIERAEWPAPLYGFPDFGDGVKAAFHAFGPTTGADALDREIHARDIEPVRAALHDVMPGAACCFRFGKACMYALTPDEHFILDRHPADGRIVIAAGFSGHGYKFASVIGEIVTELAFEGTTQHAIGFLSLDRPTLVAESRSHARDGA